MHSILSGIQGIFNLIFLCIVLGTAVISWVYSYILQKYYDVYLPKRNTVLIIILEILIWIAFNFFFDIFKDNWVLISIILVVVFSVVVYMGIFRVKKN